MTGRYRSPMATAEARQAAEGVKIELVLTERDIDMARQGRHRIDVLLQPDFKRENERATNKHPVEVIVIIGHDPLD